ncbi:hypothetical protein [Metallosphaera javensis (ex Sakai et al. 2022)]|uniref:hypothetical protein n=1 Tax=Metallosphaera javensis (ex Sakai et al. 2022) TaxID=2775498 RepID=UPI00258F47E9
MRLNLNRIMWILFYAGNIYDVIVSWIGWHNNSIIESNLVVGILWGLNNSYLSPLQELEIVIAMKLFLFTIFMWAMKLAEVLHAGKYAWIILVAPTILTMVIVAWDTQLLLGLL